MSEPQLENLLFLSKKVSNSKDELIEMLNSQIASLREIAELHQRAVKIAEKSSTFWKRAYIRAMAQLMSEIWNPDKLYKLPFETEGRYRCRKLARKTRGLIAYDRMLRMGASQIPH
jgi:hypothetical protein